MLRLNPEEDGKWDEKEEVEEKEEEYFDYSLMCNIRIPSPLILQDMVNQKQN